MSTDQYAVRTLGLLNVLVICPVRDALIGHADTGTTASCAVTRSSSTSARKHRVERERAEHRDAATSNTILNSGAAERIEVTVVDEASPFGPLRYRRRPEPPFGAGEQDPGAGKRGELPGVAVGCRIVVCGAMSQYDVADPSARYGVKNLQMLVFRGSRMEGFVVPQFRDRYAEFDELLRDLWNQGRITQRSHVIPGLRSAAESVNLILQGRNEGKLMIRVADATK